MGSKKDSKSLHKSTEEMREKLFANSRGKSRIVPITPVVRTRKREQESELKKWFCDTFDVNIGDDDFTED